MMKIFATGITSFCAKKMITISLFPYFLVRKYPFWEILTTFVSFWVREKY